MKYTVQFFIAGYARPEGNEVEHYNSKREIAHALQREHSQAENYGAGYEPSEALIWKGMHEDVTDLHPDMSMVIGTRGGVILESEQ